MPLDNDDFKLLTPLLEPLALLVLLPFTVSFLLPFHLLIIGFLVPQGGNLVCSGCVLSFSGSDPQLITPGHFNILKSYCVNTRNLMTLGLETF